MNISKSQIIELRAAGLTVREIAARVGCSYQRVAQVTRDLPRPALTVHTDQDGRAVVTGDLAPKLLATHVVRALQRSADVRHEQAGERCRYVYLDGEVCDLEADDCEHEFPPDFDGDSRHPFVFKLGMG